jgi:hypothetical protein
MTTAKAKKSQPQPIASEFNGRVAQVRPDLTMNPYAGAIGRLALHPKRGTMELHVLQGVGYLAIEGLTADEITLLEGPTAEALVRGEVFKRTLATARVPAITAHQPTVAYLMRAAYMVPLDGADTFMIQLGTWSDEQAAIKRDMDDAGVHPALYELMRTAREMKSPYLWLVIA